MEINILEKDLQMRCHYKIETNKKINETKVNTKYYEKDVSFF